MQHPLHQTHSHNYSTACSLSIPRHSSDTTCRSHTKRTSKPHLQTATLHRPQCQEKITIHDLQVDSSSELDDDSDALNYQNLLQVVKKIWTNEEGNHIHKSLQ